MKKSGTANKKHTAKNTGFQWSDKKMTKEEKTIGSGQYYDTYRDTVYVRVGYNWIKEPER
jgi:hypothetical protein